MRPFTDLLASLSLAAAALTLAAPASAQDFPSRPIRIVHPYPGGGSDAVIRSLADKLKAAWGQPVLVDPKPGASETLAVTEGIERRHRPPRTCSAATSMRCSARRRSPCPSSATGA